MLNLVIKPAKKLESYTFAVVHELANGRYEFRIHTMPGAEIVETRYHDYFTEVTGAIDRYIKLFPKEMKWVIHAQL